MKAARELGSERRETVRSISGVGACHRGNPFPVREDQKGRASGVPVILQNIKAWGVNAG